MTSKRPYHPGGKGRPPEEAFAEIERNAGKQFDPKCAAAFIAMKDQIVEAMNGDRQTVIVPPNG
jgi:HD-GYP domain-containing protein (c-di-GMP phosphodiesterase class II)